MFLFSFFDAFKGETVLRAPTLADGGEAALLLALVAAMAAPIGFRWGFFRAEPAPVSRSAADGIA